MYTGRLTMRGLIRSSRRPNAVCLSESCVHYMCCTPDTGSQLPPIGFSSNTAHPEAETGERYLESWTLPSKNRPQYMHSHVATMRRPMPMDSSLCRPPMLLLLSAISIQVIVVVMCSRASPNGVAHLGACSTLGILSDVLEVPLLVWQRGRYRR